MIGREVLFTSKLGYPIRRYRDYANFAEIIASKAPRGFPDPEKGPLLYFVRKLTCTETKDKISNKILDMM